MENLKTTAQNPLNQITRRRFLGASSTLVAASAFTIVPRHVLGGPQHTAPSEKINIAGVGIGGKGRSDIEQVNSENIVALCDIDQRHAARTYKVYPDAEIFTDFREMLETREDIDAVVVATPDHLHAPVSLAAIKLGKHVYCEKPLTHTVQEARLLAEAAREAKVATQMGNQGISSESTRAICEFVWDGAIGPVREVHVWTNRPIWAQGVERPGEHHEIPDTLDWDRFIGPAPERPYHPMYHPFAWRGWWDFGTGALGDIGCHSFAPIFKVLKLGHPTSVEASHSSVFTRRKNNEFNNETYPRASVVRYKFPARGDMPPLRLTWYDGGIKPPRPEELEPHRSLGDGGTLYVGDKGKILNGRIIPETKMKAYPGPPQTLERSIGHHKDWVNACKGGKPGDSHFDFASLVTEVVLLGNIALRSEKELQWDGPNLKIPNAPDLEKYLTKEYREGWELEEKKETTTIQQL